MTANLMFATGAGGGRKGGSKPSSGTSNKAPKKYCSILTYAQHNNRELYDAIHDLCAVGSFSSRTHKGVPRELTFLMPESGSEMHKQIIQDAYGDNPENAIATIKNCILLKHFAQLADFKHDQKIFTAGRSEVTVDITGSSVKIGGAQIIADENFNTLYTDSKFHVYLIKAGTLSASAAMSRHEQSSGDMEPSVSGGAWSELREEKDERMRSPAGLALSMIETHLNMLENAHNTNDSVPKWIAGTPNNVFARCGISLAEFFKANGHTKETELVEWLYRENPMCVIPFIGIFVNDDLFRKWLDYEDPQMDYSYKSYKKWVSKSHMTPESAAKAAIEAAVACVREGDAMSATAASVQKAYADVYANAPFSAHDKQLYDEAVFVMNDYVRAAAAGNYTQARVYGKILVNHYSSKASRPILSGSSDFSCEIKSGAVHCKLIEFVLSNSFLSPNQYCAGHHEVASKDEKPPSLNPIKCVDYSPLVEKFFA